MTGEPRPSTSAAASSRQSVAPEERTSGDRLEALLAPDGLVEGGGEPARPLRALKATDQERLLAALCSEAAPPGRFSGAWRLLAVVLFVNALPLAAWLFDETRTTWAAGLGELLMIGILVGAVARVVWRRRAPARVAQRLGVDAREVRLLVARARDLRATALGEWRRRISLTPVEESVAVPSWRDSLERAWSEQSEPGAR